MSRSDKRNVARQIEHVPRRVKPELTLLDAQVNKWGGIELTETCKFLVPQFDAARKPTLGITQSRRPLEIVALGMRGFAVAAS